MYEYIIDALMESEEIQKLYEDNIIKDITFREWVKGCVDRIHGKAVDPVDLMVWQSRMLKDDNED